MSYAYTQGVVSPVTVSATSEAVLAQMVVPLLSPAATAGMTFRITCLCSFAVGGTAGTITAHARIGGLTGQSLGTCVTGTLTLSTSGAVIIRGYVTLLTPQAGAASNWSGAVEMAGTGTGATVLGAGVATPTLSIVTPQYFVVTATLSSSTSSLVMNSAIIEQVV